MISIDTYEGGSRKKKQGKKKKTKKRLEETRTRSESSVNTQTTTPTHMPLRRHELGWGGLRARDPVGTAALIRGPRVLPGFRCSSETAGALVDGFRPRFHGRFCRYR